MEAGEGCENDAGKRRSVGRREYISTAAITAAASLGGCTSITGSGSSGTDTIKLGVFENKTGSFSNYGTPKWKGYKLAVQQINENGGINGKDISLNFEDTQSDLSRTQDVARKFSQNSNIDVVMGANSSAEREAVRQITNSQDQLYFYNHLYEGGVCDSLTVCTGLVSSQQYPAIVSYMLENYGNRIYSLIPDYNFGHISSKWLRKTVNEKGGKIVNTENIPLDASQFGSTINRIQQANPDWIFSLLVGEGPSAFYDQKTSAGIELPMASTFHLAQTAEHKKYDPPALKNMHVPINFMQELKKESERANEFVKAIRDKYPETDYVSQISTSGYNGVYLYKAAVEKAGTTDQADVVEALEGAPDDLPAIPSPEGDVDFYGPTHHLNHKIWIARATEDHNIEWVGNRGIKKPDWLQKSYANCNLREEDQSVLYEPKLNQNTSQ